MVIMKRSHMLLLISVITVSALARRIPRSTVDRIFDLVHQTVVR
jgi:hypothetical protein